MICTDVSFGSAVLSISSFGGKQYCCDVCANDVTKACCPTMDENGYVRAAPRPRTGGKRKESRILIPP